MTFINKHSFKCLLGPMAKDIQMADDVYFWRVNKKRHFCTSKTFSNNDINILREYGSSNFHYMTPENVAILKQYFEIKRSKDRSIILDIEDLSFYGGKYKKIRQSINRCNKNKFELLDNFKDISDIINMIEEWSNEYTDKYFRDFSGKNTFFYKNNFHKDCFNLFVYHESDLVSFGTLSPSVGNESSYIIGKALYKRIVGLSEFTDVELYKIAAKKGVNKINMGRASNKRLQFYKSKFPNSQEEVCYGGSIKI